jgi:hypothetical protein
MVAYAYRMPAGSPGAVSRIEHLTSEPQNVDSAQALITPLGYGKPLKTVAGAARAMTTGDGVALITGWLIRSYPHGGAANDAIGTSTAPTAGLINRMKRGYMQVTASLQSGVGTPAKDGPVYFRTTAAGGKLYGDLEATSDAGNNAIIPGAFWMGPPDTAGNCEIAYNI